MKFICQECGNTYVTDRWRIMNRGENKPEGHVSYCPYCDAMVINYDEKGNVPCK